MIVMIPITKLLGFRDCEVQGAVRAPASADRHAVAGHDLAHAREQAISHLSILSTSGIGDMDARADRE
jgi:hypothetical protein